MKPALPEYHLSWPETGEHDIVVGTNTRVGNPAIVIRVQDNNRFTFQNCIESRGS